MEFKSLKNIESSFRQIRLFSIVFLASCTLLTGFSVWKSYRFAEAQREKIYVLDEGKSLIMALSQDAARNRPVEAREHVRRLHELFFTLAPDKAAIESNINRAMYLADKSLYGYYRDWNEKGFYNRLISGNVNQTIVVDSMGCDFDSYPYRVTTYARQMIIRGSNITERSLVTRCRLQSTVRSDNNPQGFMVEALNIVENAKTSRPSVCNAEEVCLVHKDVAAGFLPLLKARLVDARAAAGLVPVDLRLDERAAAIIPGTPAGEQDFDTEFLNYILAIAVVDDVDAAIAHIARHSTHHSEAIITADDTAADRFTTCVDSAAVYVNASTRFTDGGEFGLGCEMGISTQKLHARGPMGLAELCSYKYIIHGNGQIR